MPPRTFSDYNIRSQKTVTLGDDIPGWPTDAIHFSDETRAEMQLGDDPLDEALALDYAAGWHPIGVRKVLSVTGGVTVTAGFFRRPQ